MKNSKWREYSGGQLYAQILKTCSKDRQKMGIDALLEAGRWVCRWCKQFNSISDTHCVGCKMVRADLIPTADQNG